MIEQGQVWVVTRATAHGIKREPPQRPRSITRVILAVIDDTIAYSVGSSGTRYCERHAFLVWVRRYKARTKSKTRKPPPLQLVQPAGKARRARHAH
ncbi:hypothetical protein CSC66_08675 [Pseudoxanthomonas kaohsiungensis]|nr:hypothetical protein CSC66_08675 [Pseudoxanthomonas kaohsiungensis]